ncbi:MAG: tyrosine-type recombinase/integrase [Clostridia bacterium]|nr:tyrosine-type recombinase/integrase [Clostridia bacterium]
MLQDCFDQRGSSRFLPRCTHPDSPTKYFKLLSDRCNFKNLHPHKLRHTFASIAITNGADVASVSETLGHSDKAVTLRMYTHANEESKRKVSNLVEELLK